MVEGTENNFSKKEKNTNTGISNKYTNEFTENNIEEQKLKNNKEENEDEKSLLTIHPVEANNKTKKKNDNEIPEKEEEKIENNLINSLKIDYFENDDINDGEIDEIKNTLVNNSFDKYLYQDLTSDVNSNIRLREHESGNPSNLSPIKIKDCCDNAEIGRSKKK